MEDYAVHHSSAKMDWPASARLHPLDRMFPRSVTFVPLYALGFTKETFSVYLLFGAFQAIFIHSNICFRFGFLRFLIATPESHHWHHGNDPEAKNGILRDSLPILDWILGTLYLPKNKIPQTYGTNTPVPKGFAAQIMFPFRKT